MADSKLPIAMASGWKLLATSSKEELNKLGFKDHAQLEAVLKFNEEKYSFNYVQISLPGIK